MSNVESRTVGEFVWNTTTDQWYWDAAMYELHGYRAAAVRVSTDLVLDHKRDENRAHAAGLLDRSARSDWTFSNYHDIVEVSGRRRTVLVVGESRTDLLKSGASPRLSRGFMIDVTQDARQECQRAVAQVRQSAAPIQHSLGLLMGSLGLTETAAFAVMSTVSSQHNVKARDLARRFVAAAVSSAPDASRDLNQLLIEQATALASERTGKKKGSDPT